MNKKERERERRKWRLFALRLKHRVAPAADAAADSMFKLARSLEAFNAALLAAREER